MNSLGNSMNDARFKLLRHQNAFVETFFNPSSRRVTLLQGDVGLGKTVSLVALVSRLLRERPTARVLFLVPASLRSQFVQMLHKAGSPTQLVDRYRFREMLDSRTKEEFWPDGMALVLSLDFAKQPDIRDSLAGTHWDLVIVDEAHLITGVRAKALRKIGASADRVILITRLDIEPPNEFPAKDTTVVEWRRDQVVDHEGKPLDTTLWPVLYEVPFFLNSAELKLRATVGDLCKALGGPIAIKKFRTTRFLSALESSPAALESMLQRLLQGFRLLQEFDDVAEDAAENIIDRKLSGNYYLPKKVSEIATRALQEIEASEGDSKLEAFSRQLNDLIKIQMPFKRINVITEFMSTLYYLAAEIEGQRMECQIIHGGMSIEDRIRSLTLFKDTGTVLLGTMAIMTEGFDPPEVTDLILYDVPDRKPALQQLVGRFGRFGRKTQLNVYVLRPSNISDSSTAASIDLLRDLI